MAAAWYALFALTLAAAVAYLDRLVINLVIDPIRAETGISDTQISLLQGASFSLTYTFAMLPIAWLADVWNRKYIVILSIAAWSAMTIAFGLAGSFTALLLIRAGVALGEAGLTPAATSMLRDSFPPERQAFAISTLTLGTYIGSALSLAGAGPALTVLEAAKAAGSLHGDLSPWRYLFIGAGSFGVIAIVALLFTREPVRAGRRIGGSETWASYLRLTWRLRRHVLPYLLAFIGFYSITAAAQAWLPAMFIRNHHWSTHAVGLAFGATQLIGGIVGAVSAGLLVDRRAAGGGPDALLRIARIGLLAAAIGTLLVATLPDPAWAVAANVIAAFGAGVCVGLSGLGYQQMFPNAFSARAMASFILVVGVLGTSIGPTAVPVIARFLNDGGNVAPALAVWASAAGLWAVLWLTRCLRSTRPAAA